MSRRPRRALLSGSAALAAILAVPLLAGCFSSRPRALPPPRADSTGVTAESLLASIDARSTAVRSFRALSDMYYAGPKEQLHVKEVLAISRPNHLRIEMMSPFGVALQITSDGERISAYHRGERTFYRGKATAENLSRFTRLELDVVDVANLLLGFPVKRARKGRPELSFESPQGSWRVSTSLADGGSLIVWFDADSLLPVRAAEADSRAGIRYTASYASYTMVSGVAVPTEVRFEIPAQGAKIDLRYADISVNVELPPQLFTFEAPAGSKIVDLDALAAGLKE